VNHDLSASDTAAVTEIAPDGLGTESRGSVGRWTRVERFRVRITWLAGSLTGYLQNDAVLTLQMDTGFAGR
jgi:hypothetical protein